MDYTYTYPNASIQCLTVTNDRTSAERLIERGYTLFTVPQMFGMDTGPFVLYQDADGKPVRDGAMVLLEYERDAQRHISCG